MIKEEHIISLIKASNLAGFNKTKDLGLIIDVWEKGEKTHRPRPLDKDFFAVYIFKYKNKILKVGKVSGEKNNDRYNAHHYLIKGASSTLAKSLSKSPDFAEYLKKENPRSWITSNTTRYNILIPIKLGAGFVNFTEAFFILKLKPLFEGKTK